MGAFLDSPGDGVMSKVDEGLIRLCLDQFVIIATKVETSVHNKRTMDERCLQALQAAVDQVAAQADAERGIERSVPTALPKRTYSQVQLGGRKFFVRLSTC
jgi:hypothetical protein